MRLHQMQFCLGVPMTVLIGKLLFLVKPYVVRLVCLFKLYHLKQLVQSFRKELPKCFTGFHAFHAANLANIQKDMHLDFGLSRIIIDNTNFLARKITQKWNSFTYLYLVMLNRTLK